MSVPRHLALCQILLIVIESGDGFQNIARIFGLPQSEHVSHDNEEELYKWTTVDFLEQHNYTHELHNVSTADGYQLQLQRLPRIGAKPVLLLHGLMSSSLGWLCLGPGKSLGFQLHKRGYDVWLANFRGSSPYARHHEEYTDVMPEFWRYSFHEHGAYDLPAIIDHIVKATATSTPKSVETVVEDEQELERQEEKQQEHQQQQLLLIGHSQAFNAFLVLCALHPRYNQQILLMQALAPLARLRRYVRFDSNQMRRVMKFVKQTQKSNKLELFPPGELRKICFKSGSAKQDRCEYYAKNFAGSALNNKQLLEPFNYNNLLQAGSVREIKHLQQIWKSGDFIYYDYGAMENLQNYHSVEPPGYNLSQITVPLILYFGETDAIATPEGVHSIYAKMLQSVRGVRRIGSAKFNHFDFLVSNDVKTLVNDRLIELMEKFLEGKLPYIIE